MEIGIFIDEFTNCLVKRDTGRQVETEYWRWMIPIRKNEYKGWKFDWSQTEKNGYSIYGLQSPAKSVWKQDAAESSHL